MRTPPPLTQAFNRVVEPVTVDPTSEPNDFLIDESDVPPGTFHAQLVPTPTQSAPTRAEFIERRNWEIHKIQGARKCKYQEPDESSTAVKQISNYTDDQQGLMLVMRASLQYYYLTRSPWHEDDEISVGQAKVFARKHTSCPVDDFAINDFVKPLINGSSQIRSAGQDLIKTLVRDYFQVKEGDVRTIAWLQARDRCLYPGGNLQSRDFFNTALIGNVLATLFFRTSRKIGIIFMDELLEKDNDNDVARLLSIVALSGDDGTRKLPVIIDRSASAACGPSLASIVFACVHIQHALERLKTPIAGKSAEGKKVHGKGKKEFKDVAYESTWAYYVRELAAHPNLGQLRSSFLDRLK
ncbi:hypothetical protein BDV93DRAFT_562642 [Ceratobasidium sp. AG-I]|nr:hypothetical protein BDV93DRAFT_562642 [Ceratobasidium sp. AG-I]